MPRLLVRLALLVLGSAVLVASGAAISAAASSVKAAPTTALACLDTHGGLVVPTKDKCPSGVRTIHLPLSTVRGARGPTGARGPAGAPGASGASGALVYVTSAGTEGTLVTARCPTGKVALGGGGFDYNSTPTLELSYPSTDSSGTAVTNGAQATGWTVKYAGSIGVSEVAFVICSS